VEAQRVVFVFGAGVVVPRLGEGSGTSVVVEGVGTALPES